LAGSFKKHESLFEGAMLTFDLPEKKHRQHHVWQYYLEPWTANGKVFSLIGGKPCRPNTKNVAVERHFYRLHRLTEADLKFIKLFIIDAGPAHAKRLHEEFLAALLAPRAFVEQNRHRLKNLEKIEELLETLEINVLEDYHANIENSFATTLLAIRNGDISFYEDQAECIMFARYMATQYMRTKAIKVRMIETFQRNVGMDISRIWDIASLMHGVNIGCSLFLGRKQQALVLVRNNTNVEFITGDQPVINLHGGDRSKAPTQLCMYYPIGPSMALIWGDVNERVAYTSETLTTEQVADLNNKMVAASHSQVFARTETSLAHFAVT
jgi:hypothetical protein